jgi:hypothetical protein
MTLDHSFSRQSRLDESKRSPRDLDFHEAWRSRSLNFNAYLLAALFSNLRQLSRLKATLYETQYRQGTLNLLNLDTN